MQHPTVGLRKNLIKRGNKPCGLTIDHPVGYYIVLNGWPFCEKKAQSDMCFDLHINVMYYS